MRKLIFVLMFFLTLITLLSWIKEREAIKTIDIDKTEHLLTACEGSSCMTFPVTTGGLESPTANGNFKVLNKDTNIESYHGYTFPLWVGVYLVGGYENGIHSVQGDNPWTESIGKENTTAGSIILTTEDMQKLYEWVEVGTLIYIHN